MIAEILVLVEALHSLRSTMVFDPRDWSKYRRDAWMYGIVVGWDETALEEVAELHGWKAEEVELLKKYAATVNDLVADHKPDRSPIENVETPIVMKFDDFPPICNEVGLCTAPAGASGIASCVHCGKELHERDGHWYTWDAPECDAKPQQQEPPAAGEDECGSFVAKCSVKILDETFASCDGLGLSVCPNCGHLNDQAGVEEEP